MPPYNETGTLFEDLLPGDYLLTAERNGCVSDPELITINEPTGGGDPPTIDKQPQSQCVRKCRSACFCVHASPPEPNKTLLYQWEQLVDDTWVPLEETPGVYEGVDTSHLRLPHVTCQLNGSQYRAVVWVDECGNPAVISDPATLHVRRCCK